MNNFEKGFHGNADDLHAQKAYNGDQHVYKDNLENLVDPDRDQLTLGRKFL